MSKDKPRLNLHLGIAEQGKLLALAGEHTEALMHYREAMRLAVNDQAPEAFFRHYMECSLESLEHLGHFDDVLATCDKGVAHYAENPPPNELAIMDLAAMHQRRAVILLKSDRIDEARAAFQEAMHTAREAGAALPLAQGLLRWLAGGLTITPARLAAELKRHNYYSVRKDTVDEKRAVPLPMDARSRYSP